MSLPNRHPDKKLRIRDDRSHAFLQMMDRTLVVVPRFPEEKAQDIANVLYSFTDEYHSSEEPDWDGTTCATEARRYRRGANRALLYASRVPPEEARLVLPALEAFVGPYTETPLAADYRSLAERLG